MKTTYRNACRKLRLIGLLLSAQKTTSIILVLCVAASYFAMRIVLGPSVAMTEEIRSSSMTDSYSLDFSENGITERSRQLLKDLFDGRMTIQGQSVSSGFYGSFSGEAPTILGVKNCGNNAWYVRAEGRDLSESEEASGTDVAIISRYDYEWDDFSIESHFIELNGNQYQIVGLGEFTSPELFFMGKQEVYHKLSHTEVIRDLLDDALSDPDKQAEAEELQKVLKCISQTILIPYTNYTQNDFATSVVCVMFPGLAGSAKAEMRQLLSEYFPEAVVTASPDATQFMEAAMRKETVMGVALSCCCLLFICALFIFWIEQNRKAIGSCRIVGASEKTMRRIICFSWIFILLIGYFASLVLSGLCAGLFAMLKMSIDIQIGYHAILFVIPVLISLLSIRFDLKGGNGRGIVQ